MAIDIYTTQVLTRVVELMPTPAMFLLNTFFPMVQEATTEEIIFDVDASKPRITPFVHPVLPGKVVADRGYQTNSFKPAYAKDKRVLQPGQPVRRMAGEQVGGSMSPMQRRQAQVAQSLRDQLTMLDRREEVMASEAMRTGKVTVTGEGYPTKVVDFQRDAGLTVVLTAGARWGQAGVSLISSLETWAQLVQTKSGAKATTVVMDPKAWGLFRVDAEVKDRLSTLIRTAVASTLDVGPSVRGDGRERARYVGFIGDFDIYVYQDAYVDENGATQQMLPDYTVIMGAAGGQPGSIEGTRCYGLILDEKANYQAQRYFVKSWLEEDPAVRYLLLQSAPLTVPYRPNASFTATVN